MTLGAVKEKAHYVYVLYAENRTYTGYTNDPARRLRQHNSELAGGAKSTRGRCDWRFLTLSSCRTWNSRRALQCEYKYKHPDGKRKVAARYRGVAGRLSALPLIWSGIPDPDLVVRVCDEHYDSAAALPRPANVTVDRLCASEVTVSTDQDRPR